MSVDDDDCAGSPEAVCIRRQANSDLLAKITADTTGPEILAFADKLAARWFVEREEWLDVDDLVYLLDRKREWALDRRNNR
jgi:CMP-N-acetylneuraminic acid synthetase